MLLFRTFRRASIYVGVAAVIAATPVAAAGPTAVLRAVRGTSGYAPAKDAPFTRVFGTYLVSDDQFAVTQAASNALLITADSSEVALGEAATVGVGAITQAEATAPKSMTLVAGSIRFVVRHPSGQPANYRFQTVTSQLAVRGTIGLYSTGPNGDVVTCLDCSAGDLTVTAGGTTTSLLTGQTAFISIAGIVTVSSTTAAIVSTFSNAGLGTTSDPALPFAHGIGVAHAAAAAGTTAIEAGAAAAAAAGIGIGISNSNAHSQSTPGPQMTPAQSGSATISGGARTPTLRSPAPAATATATPGLPVLAKPGRR